MSAMYRAAGGQTDASGVPTTKGSSYKPALAGQAMGVVKKQYNAVQDAAQQRDAQQAAARQQAANRPGTAAPYCDPADQKAAMCGAEGRITNQYWPPMTGTTRDGWAGLQHPEPA